MEKRRGHVRNASNWSTTSAVRKRTTTYNEKRDYHSVLQKFGKILYLDFKKFGERLITAKLHFIILLSVRGCQYGVIHSLERFFLWFVTLVLKTSNTLNRFSNQLKSDLEMTLRYLTLYLMCRYGELVASHPVKAIIGCFIVTALGGAGLFR